MSLTRRTLLPLCLVALASSFLPLAASAEDGSDVIAQDRIESYDLGGYFGNGGNGGIAATFTVPAVTCDPARNTAMLPSVVSYYEPGADRFVNGGGGVDITCSSGVATYTPVLFGPENEYIEVPRAVAGGDKVTVTFASARSGNSSTIRNITQGWKVTDRSPFFFTVYGRVGDTVGYVDDFPAPPPAFDDHTFSKVTLDGKLLTKDRWIQADLIADPNRELLLDASRLRKGTFTVTRS